MHLWTGCFRKISEVEIQVRIGLDAVPVILRDDIRAGILDIEIGMALLQIFPEVAHTHSDVVKGEVLLFPRENLCNLIKADSLMHR